MREEEKADARRFFNTPLLFSIKEAKGLEYENVILVNFISNERTNFLEILNGVSGEDLSGDLEYMRARDKTDKSLEVYKFFVNALYVAVTRAVQRIYIVESDIGHPLIGMLGIENVRDNVAVEVKQSTLEEWQAEAHRLELQGRQEQADEIRREILKVQPVPWDVCTSGKVIELLTRARDAKEISQKPKKTLFEYGLFYDEPRLIEVLSLHGFDKAKQIYYLQWGRMDFNRSLYNQQRANLITRCMHGYTGKFYKDIIRQCEIYGTDHRNVFNMTPLMLAASAGNATLVQELLAAGADTELTDNYGLTAWQTALQRAAQDKKFASDLFPLVHEILAPSSVSVKVDGRLIKIDSKQGEFLLFHIFLAVLRNRINYQIYDHVPLTAVVLTEIVASLSDSIIPDYRKKRTYISALLSKNECDSTNPYNKKLFRRKRTGNYILNPKLAIRLKEEWIDIYRHANIDLISNIGSESGERFRAIIRSLISTEKDLF